MNRITRTCLGAAAALAIAGVAFTTGAAGGAPSTPPVGPADQAVPAGPSPRSTRTGATTDTEDSYRSITPCRIVDGRQALGELPSGQTRSYEVRGTTGFAPQGGKSGGCGIPTAATAVTFSITVVSPNRSGFLRAWPAGTTEPQATLLNYTAGQSQTVTAPVTLGASSGAKDLTVKSSGADAQLVIDVQGYYTPPIHAVVNLDGTLSNGTSRVLASAKVSTGQYRVDIDRPVVGCTATANAYGSGTFFANAVPNGSSVYVYAYNASGAGALTNITFEVDVSC